MGVPTVTITSEGTALDPTVGILSVEVRRELNRVPEATITVVDGSVAERKFAQSDTGFFEPGKSLAIAVRDGDGEDTTLFEGLVVRHAVESRPGTSSLRVELKDAAFKLTRQRKTAVFRKQADDEAIQKLIGDAGLQVGELASTQPQHEELIQFYASDWDFIVSRADVQGPRARSPPAATRRRGPRNPCRSRSRSSTPSGSSAWIPPTLRNCSSRTCACRPRACSAPRRARASTS